MAEIRTIVTVGEILVEFVSHQKNCALEQITEYSGPYPSGAPAIFLDQAARMGAATQMIGGVGDDGFGRRILRRLREDGVGIDGITVSDEHSTGTAFVSYYDSGDRDFIFHIAGTAADAFTVRSGVFAPAQTILHVSASSLGISSMRDKIMDAVRSVGDGGGLISCDPNARPELMNDPVTRDAMFEVMESSSILLPSTSDLDFLYPDLSEDAAVEKLLNANADIVAVKRGAGGVTIVSNGERHDFAGYAVSEVDPTGAGDCFCGTFVSLISQGASLYDAGMQANAAGAIAVTRRGPMEGNSNPSEIAQFLNSRSPKENIA
ncbi:sugar kinase [Octadecabacter sp. R77987]|uniref:sugar kinase n=1 Tax=Octadecabacter sp. R77987 TaxID=3093874 RepID=UPI00366ADCC0